MSPINWQEGNMMLDSAVSTPFNRRLISSTPDPERLADIEEPNVSTENSLLQMIPEKDVDAKKSPKAVFSWTTNLFQRIKNQRVLHEQLSILNNPTSSELNIGTENYDHASSTLRLKKAEMTNETSNPSERKQSLLGSRTSSNHNVPLTSEITLTSFIPSPEQFSELTTPSTLKNNFLNSAFISLPLKSHALIAEEIKTPKQKKSLNAVISLSSELTDNDKVSTICLNEKNDVSQLNSISNVKLDSGIINSFTEETSADTCDLEISCLDSTLNERNVSIPKKRDIVAHDNNSSNVSQLIEFLKTNPQCENIEKQFKEITKMESLASVSKEEFELSSSNDKLDDLMSHYITITNDGKGDSNDEKANEASVTQIFVTPSTNVNQNYNSDSDNEATGSRRRPKNLHYLESMADPTLRNIACRLSFKATALRDIELRDLIDDMIYFTDAALGKEHSQNQSACFFLREENYNLQKQIDKVKHQLELSETQESKCSQALQKTSNEVLHLETKLRFLLEEKDKLDSQVTSLLEERAKWLSSQQDLVKTISLKDRELLKLNEKHHEEKKSFHQSLEQVSKKTLGVHKKLSGADREIEKLQQRLKCKDLDIEDQKAILNKTNQKLKDCEANSLKKDQEIVRLQELIDSLKIGVDNVLQVFETSYTSSMASLAHKQGIEHLRRIIQSNQYRSSDSLKNKTQDTLADHSHSRRKVFNKSTTPKKVKEFGPSSGKSKSHSSHHRPMFVPTSNHQGGYSKLTSQAIEQHNQLLSPLDEHLRKKRAGEEIYFSDTEINLHHNSIPLPSLEKTDYSADIPQESKSYKRQRRKSESDKYDRHVQMKGKTQAINSDDDLVTIPVVQSLEEIHVASECDLVTKPVYSSEEREQNPWGHRPHTHSSTVTRPPTHYSTVTRPHTHSSTVTRPHTHSSTGTIPNTQKHHGYDREESNVSTLRSEPIPTCHLDGSHKRSFRNATCTSGQYDSFLKNHFRNNIESMFSSTEPKHSTPTFENVLDRNPRCPTADLHPSSIPNGQPSLRSFLLAHNSTRQEDEVHSKLYQRDDQSYSPYSHYPTVQFDDESTLKHPGLSEESNFYNVRSTLPNHSSPLHTSDTSFSRRATRGNDSPVQTEFFGGTDLSLSISSITDSDSVFQTCNNNRVNREDSFTTGIASLDEKIANLQKKINRTKAIFMK
ncbi:hypothetical protein BgiBS90_030308 [Biomphalaria glabrata]|nr:hypothetical protein BgiBS90_030308 [Biomphalaria glabrata]